MGIQQMLLGGGNRGSVAPATTYIAAGVNVPVHQTFAQDGTTRKTINGVNTNTANWFNPSTVGIGASYWIRFDRTSGPVSNFDAEGVWHQMNVIRQVGYTAGPAVKEWLGTAKIAAGAGGVPLLVTHDITVLIDF